VDSVSSYTLVVATQNSFAAPLIVVPLIDTSYVPAADLPVGAIYWRVRADSHPYSRYSTFTIQSEDVPFLVPYEPEVTRDRTPTLRWHSVDGATTYTLAVADTVSFTDPMVSLILSDTSYTLAAELPAGMTYWHVKSDLDTTWSAVDSFYIQPDTIPFLVRFSGDTVGDRTPAFAWHPVTGATSYRVQIADNAAFTDPMAIPVSDTTYTPAVGLAFGRWYWRVSCSLGFSLYPPADSLYIDQVTLTLPTRPLSTLPPGIGRWSTYDLHGRLIDGGRSTRTSRVRVGGPGVYIVEAQGKAVRALVARSPAAP
jgi:hypothetical protein